MQRLRFSQADPRDIQERILHYMTRGEDDDEPFVAKNTQNERERVWNAWKELAKSKGGNKPYSEGNGFDFTCFWEDFARTPSDPRLQAPVQAFLETYVKASTKSRIVLGPEERVLVRTVNSAYSVIEIWRRLVAAADWEVLRKKRRELRLNDRGLEAKELFLKWEQEGTRREGPAFLIVKWIIVSLAPELHLELNTAYVKVEATSDDIITILQTLYLRADDIGVPPLKIIAFHAALLKGSTTGARTGTLANVKCKKYILSLIRDPDDWNKRLPVVTPTIERSKIKEAEKTSKYKKNKSISYSTTLVPYPILCLASLVIARGLVTDAWDTEKFSSYHEFLNRPNIDGTGCIDIPWKEAFLDEPLFPITAQEITEIWALACLIAGIPRHIRFYSVRLGAANRLDEAKTVTNTLRNYIIGHTGAVFEHYYQPGRLRVDLAGLAFGRKAGGRKEQLFNKLRNMTLRRDEGAPISITKQQKAAFFTRDDVTKLQARINATSDEREKNKLRSEKRGIIETCTKLQLEKDREEYFDKARQLRLKGIKPEPSPDAGGPGIAAPLASLIEASDKSETLDSSISERWINAVMQYMLSKPKTKALPAARSTEHSICYACRDEKEFSSRSALTRHFQAHRTDGTFDRPLACHACRRLGISGATFSTPAQWCNHLELTHGKKHTPASLDLPSKPLGCLICEKPLASRDTLITHMNRIEIPGYTERRNCPECFRSGQIKTTPLNIWEWIVHAQATHGWYIPDVVPCCLCGHLCLEAGLQRHLAARHKDMLGKALDCAACEVLPPGLPGGRTEGASKVINSVQELLDHAREKHSPCQAQGTITTDKSTCESAPSIPKHGESKGLGESNGAVATKRKRSKSMQGWSIASAPKRVKLAPMQETDTLITSKGNSIDVQGRGESPCEKVGDVIVCAPTVGEVELRQGLISPDLFTRLDPALLLV